MKKLWSLKSYSGFVCRLSKNAAQLRLHIFAQRLGEWMGREGVWNKMKGNNDENYKIL